ncbi:MAG: hypothetical protein II452_07490, partial [Paludibacteraceae bacterium]|nr:hypothetical protein [Paludibacteraceae bacterium]
HGSEVRQKRKINTRKPACLRAFLVRWHNPRRVEVEYGGLQSIQKISLHASPTFSWMRNTFIFFALAKRPEMTE